PDNNIFQSPFDKRNKDNNTSSTEAPCSYGANTQIVSADDPKNMDDAKFPSQLILMSPVMVTTSPISFTGGGTFAAPLPTGPTVNGEGNAGGTHNSGKRIKVVMLDGHV